MAMDGDKVSVPPVCTTPSIPGGKNMRVLICNAYGPYELKWGQSPSDLLGARLARGHAMLERAAELPTWSMYLIAENITNEATVLEYPRWREFVSAIDDGYDVVCIEVKTVHIPRITRMVKTIRERSPKTKVVLGGYGVGTLHEGVPHDPDNCRDYLLNNVDYFCRTEGIRFMRELLGDAPYDRPFTQYTLPPATVKPYAGKHVLAHMPAILVSLGCPAACDFCNTSAFFHHKKISVFSPAEIYDCMKHHARTLGKDELTFILFDEDIFLDPPFVREIGRLIRSDRKTWGFRWISFGSMKALEAFTPRELRECGVEGIWIGVESGLQAGDANAATYAKRKTTGRTPQELFDGLRSVGIFTIGSTILGFDFHTPDNIEQDINYFVNLRPTFYQVGPIRPCPGTKLYKLMKKDQKIKQNYTWEDFHLWESGTHNFEHFTGDDVKHWFDVMHDRLKNVNGSPVLQIYDGNLSAYATFRDDPSEYLRHQAQMALGVIKGLYPVIVGLVDIAPSESVKDRTRKLIARAQLALANDSFLFSAYRTVAGQFVRIGLRGLERFHKSTATMWAPDMRKTRYRVRHGARVAA